MDTYETYRLDNGLRVIHLQQNAAVNYCGIIVDVGSRDEQEREEGMAHLIEHMLFKGTKKRSSTQIINRLEDVGGELNAYTSKEETVLYAGVLKEYTERAIELIADLVQHATFPADELQKEVLVIRDEIQSYNDSPYDLIFDAFEELLYDGNSLSHSVLGCEESLEKIVAEDVRRFYRHYYQPENMVFFSSGDIAFEKLIQWLKKYFLFEQNGRIETKRQQPVMQIFQPTEVNRDTHQVHALIGGRAYDMNHANRLILYMLNNILGGPGMNSKLNMALREKNGLVYNVESAVQTYTDNGWWGVYFGTDAENFRKCERLVKRELLNLQQKPIAATKLKKYKEQLRGQLAISNENRENLALAMGKSYLRYGKFDSLDEIQEKIMGISAEQLQQVACELFQPGNLVQLKYY